MRRPGTALRQPPALRVVEFAQGIAGPVVGQLFAGLGHEVIKCEPPGGDYLRTTGACPAPGEPSFAFAVLNAGKRDVVVELDTDVGRERACALVSTADVVITDFGPDRIDLLHLRGEARKARWPNLVVTSLTGFGLDSEWSNTRPDSLLAEAFGGLANMIGEPEERPLSLGGEQSAYAAGFVGFFGAMLALEGVRAGAGGDLADVALADVAAYIDWKSDIGFATTGVVPTRSGTRHGRWRMVRACDGWAGIVYQPEKWPSMVELIGDARLADPRFNDSSYREANTETWWPAVEQWAAVRTQGEIYEDAQKLGLPFGVNIDVAGLTELEHYRARGFVPEPGASGGTAPVGIFFSSNALEWKGDRVPRLGENRIDDYLGGRPRAVVSNPRSLGVGLLHDMVVLDLGTITAGSAVGRLLADHGATVIKVESTEHPDSFRHWIVNGAVVADIPGKEAVSPVFESNNAGKLGVTLDLKSDAEHAKFLELVRGADVVLENFRVGVTERLSVDYATVRETNPEIIYLSLSSQGQSGPEASFSSYGSTLDMLSGLASVTGYRDDGPPIWSSVEVNYPDQFVSLFGAGIVSYCWNRGIGAHIDVSQREAVSWTLSDRIEEFRATGKVARPSGNHRPGVMPHDVYRTLGPDSWVAIACFDDVERASLARRVGLPVETGDWSALSPLRLQEIDEAISSWTSRRSREECVSELNSASVPCVPVLTASDRAHHLHFLERRVFLEDPVRRKGFPLVLEQRELIAPDPAPELGEHNRVVLGRKSIPLGAGDRS